MGKFSYILPEDAIVPKGTSEVTKKVSWRSLLAEGKIERRLAEETIESWKAQLPDFWDQLNGLREFLEVKKMICPEK